MEEVLTAQRSDGEDADRYELALRKRDARSSLVIGVVLLGLGVGTLFVWYIPSNTLADLPVVRNGGLGLLVLGGWSLLNGLRKRAHARSFERSLGAGPSGGATG